MKNFLVFTIVFVLIIPASIPLLYFFFSPETRVCGIDGENYPSSKMVEKLGIAISYDFPCEVPKSEDGLFERTEDIKVAGQVLSFFTNSKENTLYIKSNKDGKNYFISNKDTSINLNEYLPGDQLMVEGSLNKNTFIIQADKIDNVTLANSMDITIDCSITSIDTDFKCFNDKEEYVFDFNTDIKIVAGLVNPATVQDLLLDDSVRIRFDENLNLQTVLVTKRGNTLYLKNNIFSANAIINNIDHGRGLVELNLPVLPTSVSSISDLSIIVKIDKNTRMVRKYFGLLSFTSFSIGDEVSVTINASEGSQNKLIMMKNNSVWK